jgi:hypothetical protein
MTGIPSLCRVGFVNGEYRMRIEAALSGSLSEILDAERRAVEQAVTAGVRAAAEGLKAELRAQVTGAGLGQRLARTWRSASYPKGGTSLGAAALVWSKAPDIVRVFDQGAVIRSRRGLWLAIPTAAAGRTGDGGRRMTPEVWERSTGMPLRFVYRRGRPSLLVVDHARLNSRGRAVANRGRKAGAGYSRLAGRTMVPLFILVPQVTMRKRLDIDSAARRWLDRLPPLILGHWTDPTQ